MHYPYLDSVPQPPILTAGDLRGATCEFALLVEADVLLGRREAVEVETDPMRERLGQMGIEHELRVSERLSGTHPGGERTVPAPGPGPGGHALAHAETLRTLSDPTASLVQQAAVRGERFMGRIDHLVRDEEGRWIVVETKLARSAHTHALVQVAAYAEALAADGIPVAPFVRLQLGDGSTADTPIAEVLPELRERRRRVLAVLDTHLAEGEPADWEDERLRTCLRCDACRAEMVAREDVGLVAGVSSGKRRLLRAAGLLTMAELAGHEGPVEGLDEGRLAALRSQARLQVTEPTPQAPLPYEVHDPAALAGLPPHSDGDVFFDFEGDPMWSDGTSGDWGLEYLFGCLTADGGTEEFTPFWAHDREAERRALIDFVDWLAERRSRWPDLHVFHFAAYEPAALTRMAARHGVYEERVAELLEGGVFVDLYAVLRAGVRVGSPSYSIKRLEPLYMGEELRDADGVTAGGESVIEYQHYREATAAGDHAAAAGHLEALRRYNRYDCVSTRRLCDWLRAHALT